jgi:dihydropyrimidinase
MYGLYPRKGSIAIGADADLAIWDPNREVTITNDQLHHNVDYTPYEGVRVRDDDRARRGRLVGRKV